MSDDEKRAKYLLMLWMMAQNCDDEIDKFLEEQHEETIEADMAPSSGTLH